MKEVLYPEEWRVIPVSIYPELEGLYEASTRGRIRRMETKRVKSTHLKFSRDKYKPYEAVDLNTPMIRKVYHNKKGRKMYLVHRLVAHTFLEYAPENYQVHHKDGNKLNNMLSNLVLLSPAEHARIETKLGTRKGFQTMTSDRRSEIMKDSWSKGKMDRQYKPVYSTDASGVLIKNYGSIKEASRDGFSAKGITQNLIGNSASSGGLVWHYGNLVVFQGTYS